MLLNHSIFELTEKGKLAVSSGMTSESGVSGDAKFIMPLFGHRLTLAEVVAKLPPSVRACCVANVKTLLAEGYIVGTPESGDDMQPLNFVMPGDELTGEEQLGDTKAGLSMSEIVAEEDDGLDFTGKFQSVKPPQADAENIAQLIANESLEDEIESRSQKLAVEKIKQFEQDMNNTLARVAEHEALKVEQEKITRQQEMVESARLSPIYENLRGLVFFNDFSDAELAEVLHIGVWSENNEQDVLVHEGDNADSFFVMLSGLAGVFKRERLIGLVQSGESFGEFSFLMGEEEIRHADVIARSHVEFMGFSTDKINQATQEVRLRFAAAFARCQTRRLVCANEQIINLLTSEN